MLYMLYIFLINQEDQTVVYKYSRTILAVGTVERIVIYTTYTRILCISIPYTFFNVRMSIKFSCGRAGSVCKI